MQMLRNRGFSLIEMIGVMAIMAILASAIAPSVFDDIKRARQDKESKTLETFAGELQRYIEDTKTIPNRNLAIWTGAIASVSTRPREQVELNEKNFRRGYYVDPRFFTTTDTAFGGYIQQAGRATAPNSPRIMLVSLLTANAPNAPTTAAAFNAIWDQSPGATLLEGPDVKIERINLRATFQRVVLTNENTNQPGYALESGTRFAIPAAGGGGNGILERYVIRNTRVNLYTDTFPGGNLDQAFLVEEDKDYAYQLVGSAWVWQRP